MDFSKGSSDQPGFPVACLVASAGGLDPLVSFFASLPGSAGLACLVLQHHLPDQPRLLPELLARKGTFPVRQARAGDPVRAGQALVLDSGMTLEHRDGQLWIAMVQPVPTPNRPGDLLFRSAAACLGARAIGIVLSGTGNDGTEGLRAIQAAQGLTLAQAPESATHPDMPQAAVRAGVVTAALAPDQLAARALQISGPAAAEPGLLAICRVLEQRTGNDFTHYKPGTLGRRIERRMRATRALNAEAYLAILEASEAEQNALLKDLLISVTEFFRDPEAFTALRHHLLPLLRAEDPEPLRIWVPGCASGEEAYGLGIMLQEALAEAHSSRPLQIFATDIDATALAKARAGRYPAEALQALSEERKQRFFKEDGGLFQVRKTLRDCCVFALHNLLRDPPFSSMHLISCRNVFIYMDPALQARLIPVLHFGLKPGGLLFLGRSEGLASQPNRFEPLDKANRVYRRQEGFARQPLEFPLVPFGTEPPGKTRGGREASAAALPLHAFGLFEQMLMKDYLPASAVVNEQGDALFWAGRIGQYLVPPLGAPSTNLLTSTSGPLHVGLRRLLAQVAAHPAGPAQAQVLHSTGQGQERLRLTLRPMPGLSPEARIYAVVIESEGPIELEGLLPSPEEVGNSLLDQVSLELQATRVELQVTVEELESANEALQSANEELQSSNEELQSSQEELRSVNEELNTTNGNLTQKVSELYQTNSDLQNLMASTEIPTLFLDTRLGINRFTPSATELFGLIEADLGRSIRNLVPLFEGLDLPALAEAVLASHATLEAQAHSLTGDRWYLARLRPYRTPTQAVDGVVVTFVDCTEIRRAGLNAVQSEASFRNLFKRMGNAFAHCRMRFEGDRPVDFQYLAVNDAFRNQTRHPGEVVGHWVSEVIPGIREQDEALFALYGRVARGGGPERMEIFVQAVRDWYDVSVYSPAMDEFVAVFDVITERKQAAAALLSSERRLNLLIEHAPAALALFDRDMCYLACSRRWRDDYGLGDDDLLGRSHYQIFPEIGENWKAVHRRGLAGEVVRADEDRFERADGSVQWLRWEVLPWHDGSAEVAGIVISSEEITEQIQGREQLRASEARYRSLFVDSHAAMIIIDPASGQIVDANPSAARFYGWSVAELCQKNMREVNVLPPEAIAEQMRQTLAEGQREIAFQHRLADGRIRDVDVFCGRINLGGRDLLYSIIHDVTERNRAMEELQISKANLALAFSTSPDPLAITRLSDGRYLLVNEKWSEFHGYSTQEALGRTSVEMGIWSDAEARARWLEELAAHGSVSGMETTFKRADGACVIGHVSSTRLVWGGEAAQLSIVRDITDLKRSEQERRLLQIEVEHMQRLESIGRLAGGVAHDMNNILAAIYAVVNTLQSPSGQERDLKETLAIVERAADRGRDLVRSLVGFARKDLDSLSAVDINALVRQEIALLERTLKQKHQLIMDLDESLPAIEGEYSALGSALMNLCVNAVDAMPGGGALAIRTRRLDDAVIQIAVEDTGEGMPPEVLQRAMEPFFTTKPMGKGTGLGLASVFTTVRAHGGTLTLNSELGKGTQVLVNLPIQNATATPAQAAEAAPAGGGARSILLVDDDELLRATVPMLLQTLGDRVEAVASGRAALDRLDQGSLPDLVILDMNMPEMSGLETLRHIRARYPELRVLLATGFLEPEVDQAIQADPFALAITKPFSLSEIQLELNRMETLARPAGLPEPERLLQAWRAAGPTPAAAPPQALFLEGDPTRDLGAPPLQLLLIEDNPMDALLIEALLKKRGLDYLLTRIQSSAELDAALAAGGIDLILSDYRLPGWDGLVALRRVRASAPDLPFFLISGSVGEEIVVESMRAGATDVLFKDRLLRLVPAIERALRESRERRNSRALEAERAMLHQAIQQGPDWVMLADPEGRIIYVNPAAEAVTGYPRDELMGQNPRILKSGLHPAEFFAGLWQQLLQGQPWTGTIHNRRKDGSLWQADTVITPMKDAQGTITGFVWGGRTR
jgi:two-component system CheB/CheR fusion protein